MCLLFLRRRCEVAAEKFVGAAGFEPATSWSRTKRASRAAPHPEEIANNLFKSRLGSNASSALLTSEEIVEVAFDTARLDHPLSPDSLASRWEFLNMK